MRDFDRDDPDASAGSVIGWALRRVVLWGGIGLVLYLAVGYRIAAFPNRLAEPAQPIPEAAKAAAPPNALVYRADRLGHVYLQAAVNGVPIRFLVDTGATWVSLSRADAAAAGIGAGELVFNKPMSTANGISHAAAVTLRELRLDQLTLYDVPAVVNENLAGTALLGMSFLTRLQSYEMRDGVLTLNW